MRDYGRLLRSDEVAAGMGLPHQHPDRIGSEPCSQLSILVATDAADLHPHGKQAQKLEVR